MRAIVCGVFGIVAAMPAAAQILPQDPVFANSFDSGAVSLAPIGLYIAQGAVGDTLPVALTLTLSEPAVSDTFVPVVSADPARLAVVNGGTTVLTGQSTATVQLSGVAGGASPVTVTATLGNAVSVGVRVEAALNEVGSAGGEADFCTIQFPLTYDTTGGQTGPTLYGQLFEAGVTEAAGPPVGWISSVGYGPSGSDPRLLTGWHFVDATYNTQAGNNDEFMGALVSPWTVGDHAYAYRFSQDEGVSWTYCDTNAAGAIPGVDFDTASLGTLTVHRSLVINEVDYDNPASLDTMEFVEIYNTAPTPVDLSGVALVLVNGNNGDEYRRVDLGPAGVLAPGAYLVVHDGAVSLPAGTLELTFASCTDTCIQNGAPDGVALIDTAGAVLIDALSYEGSITEAHIAGFPAPVSLVEGTATTAIDANTAGSLVRLPNGSDTDDANADWALSVAPTPGAANTP